MSVLKDMAIIKNNNYIKVTVVGVVLTLIMSGLYYAFYSATNNYKTQLKHLDETTILTGLLSNLEGDILRTRQIEKQYQINKSDIYVAAFRHGLDQIINGASEIQTLAHSDKLHHTLIDLIKSIARYQYHFFSLEDKFIEIGRDHNLGLQGRLSQLMTNIEVALNTSIPTSVTERNNVNISILTLRLYEKELLSKLDSSNSNILEPRILELKNYILNLGASNTEPLLLLITEYENTLNQLIELTLSVKETLNIIDKTMLMVPDLLTELRGEITILETKRHEQLLTEIDFINLNLLISAPIAFILTWLLITSYWRREQSSHQALTARNQAIKNHDLAMTTLKSIGDGIIITDASGHITNVNPVAETIIGQELSSLEGRQINRVIDLRNNLDDTRKSNPILECLRLKIIVTESSHGTVIHRANGTQIPIEESAAPIISENGELIGAIMVLRDVTEQRKLIAHIEHQAHHDPLTGLSNRSALKKALEYAWLQCQKRNSEHALVFIDLDRFKIVNDTCGHHAGDELLKSLTELIREQVRNSDILSSLAREKDQFSDTFARVGGDEFALLLQDCPLYEAELIAEHIVNAIKDYVFIWDGKHFKVGASIGIAQMSNRYTSISEVMQNADTACYEAKNRGRGKVYIHRVDDELLDRRHREMSWVPRLNQAITDNLFVLRRQLIAPIKSTSHRENHYEILISMRENDSDELILPGAFLPAAERYHMMADIDRWVITQTFKNIACSCDLGIYAINLSGDALGDEEMLTFIKNAINEYNIAPKRLIFEITESAAISNLGHCQNLMENLRQIGCKFSLDDFGTGLSSFSYLKSLHVDYIKIDGSFVRHIATNKKDFTIVESINTLAHKLGMETIAEFVEDEACLETINHIGIDYAQGWALGFPTAWEPTDTMTDQVTH